MSLITQVVVATFVGWIIYSFTKLWLASRRPKNFPPGPPTIPILGNLLQLPLSKAYLRWESWTQAYGTIIGFKLGPMNAIVLNHHKHVKELFDNRGAIYSSRPENYIGAEVLGHRDIHILLMQYGNAWRHQRKAVQGLLNVTVVDTMMPIQNAETLQTLHHLLTEPEGYYDHFRRFSTSVILASVFGQREDRFESLKIQTLYNSQDRFTKLLEPGATSPVDAFRFLRHLPEFMCSWKREVKDLRKIQQFMYYRLLNETKQKVEDGETDCFMARLIRQRETNKFDDEQLAYLGGIFMEGGSDTTASTLLTFVLALIKYPRVLKEAQREVDLVCGSDRTPLMEDFDKLPYISACISEVLRWRPIAPAGVPHATIQDDTYEGYFIPKGTIVFANVWAIQRDEHEHEKPDEFRPERFLGNKFGTRYTVDEEKDFRRVTYAFGAGRRVCPGQHLAQNSLMISIAKLVWAFDIAGDGNEIDTNMATAFTDGFVTAPHKFPVQFKPRSSKHAAVIEKEFELVGPFLQGFKI